MRNISKQILILSVAAFLIQPVFGMYHQKMGRFMQHDPLGIKPDITRGEEVFVPPLQYAETCNAYQYVQSTPVMLYDPWGFFGQCGPGWLGGIIVPDDPWPFGGANFTGACENHDDCYGGGQNSSQCNVSKGMCDEQFRQDMNSACVNKYANATDIWGNPLPREKKDKKIAACFKIADIYADAVSNHGDGSFDKGRRGCPCNTP